MCRKMSLFFLAVLIAVVLPCVSAHDTKTRGERILFNGSGTLYVMDPTGLNRQRLAEHVRVGALSPRGDLVAYADGEGVHVKSLLNGQSVTLARTSEGQVESMGWSPDQRLVAYDVVVRMKSWNLFLASYPPSGDAPRNLGHWYETISFSPDGKFIVHPTLDTTGGRARSSLEVVNVETGKHEKLYDANEVIWEAQYAPDGSHIAFMMTRAGPDGSDEEPDCRGPDRSLWVLSMGSTRPLKIMDDVFDFDWSPDGRFLAIGTGTQDCGYPPGDGAVFVSSLDQKVQFKLSRGAPSLRAKFSPDAKKVLFVDFSSSPAGLVIGELSTRKLTPVVGSSSDGGYDTVYDWK